MDLGLYFRVLRRFRLLVVGGLILAVALAVLATAKVSFAGGVPQLTYRQTEVFSSDTTLFVTQKGFPWGSTVTRYAPTNPTTGEPATPLADPGRLATLTTLYAQLATGDSVHRRLQKQGAPDGEIAVNAVPAPAYSNPAILPLLVLTATTNSPSSAIKLSNLASQSFQRWLSAQQVQAEIPAERRIVVQIVHRADKVVLVAGRSKTLPAVVFLTVLAAALGLVFVLENMRPRARAVPSQTVPMSERRSA